MEQIPSLNTRIPGLSHVRVAYIATLKETNCVDCCGLRYTLEFTASYVTVHVETTTLFCFVCTLFVRCLFVSSCLTSHILLYLLNQTD
jgi:hypothetical protein